MPTYEYRCPAGHEFEKFQKMSESQAELPCPVCGEVAARRMSAGAGLVFKGSGFYITDYGKDGKKDQRQAAGASSSAEGGSSASGSDSGTAKPEAKSESKGESTSAPAGESKAEPKPAAKAESKPAASSPPPSKSSE